MFPENVDWYNCTHKNESYCQYTFLYRDNKELERFDIIMDKESIICPVIVPPDFLGWILGEIYSCLTKD